MTRVNEIANKALGLSMEFGKEWLKPISERLALLYPQLSAKELVQYDSLAKAINKMANKYVYDHPIKKENETAFVDFGQFEHAMLAKYDWISTENLQKLYSQTCYYARK